MENLIHIPKQLHLCSDKSNFNDKPADGFQQKRESKPKTLSWDFYRTLQDLLRVNRLQLLALFHYSTPYRLFWPINYNRMKYRIHTKS